MSHHDWSTQVNLIKAHIRLLRASIKVIEGPISVAMYTLWQPKWLLIITVKSFQSPQIFPQPEFWLPTFFIITIFFITRVLITIILATTFFDCHKFIFHQHFQQPPSVVATIFSMAKFQLPTCFVTKFSIAMYLFQLLASSIIAQ